MRVDSAKGPTHIGAAVQRKGRGSSFGSVSSSGDTRSYCARVGLVTIEAGSRGARWYARVRAAILVRTVWRALLSLESETEPIDLDPGGAQTKRIVGITTKLSRIGTAGAALGRCPGTIRAGVGCSTVRWWRPVTLPNTSRIYAA